MKACTHSNQITNIPIQPNPATASTASVATQPAIPMTMILALARTAKDALVNNSAQGEDITSTNTLAKSPNYAAAKAITKKIRENENFKVNYSEVHYHATSVDIYQNHLII